MAMVRRERTTSFSVQGSGEVRKRGTMSAHALIDRWPGRQSAKGTQANQIRSGVFSATYSGAAWIADKSLSRIKIPSSMRSTSLKPAKR